MHDEIVVKFPPKQRLFIVSVADNRSNFNAPHFLYGQKFLRLILNSPYKDARMLEDRAPVSLLTDDLEALALFVSDLILLHFVICSFLLI